MRLHCESLGTGPDIVLVHGWGWHGGAWKEIARGLAQEYRLWIPDLPGHGRSRDSTTASMLEDIVRAVGECVPPAAVWVGWSLGGLVALAAARAGLAQRLVLMSATPCFLQRIDWDCAWSHEWFERFSADVERDAAGALNRFASLHLTGVGNERSLLRRLRAELLRYGVSDIAGLRAGLCVLREADLRLSLPQLAGPALVIHGEHDRLVPLGAGEHLARSLPGARFVRVPAAGHALPLSHGGFLVNAIKEFST